MNEKELMKLITDYPPAAKAGVKRGWSWSEGGRRDTGCWFYGKLGYVGIEELQSCYDELQIEFNINPR